MGRPRALDGKNYLGSMSHSLEHLPKWYQILSISGIVFVIYLRDNPVVGWLVINLHSSFGTEFIWFDEYQQLLEKMHFYERLCFTLYGVALAGTVVMLYKAFCRDKYGLGWSVTQLFPDRRGMSIVMSTFLCVVEMVRMRSLIADCLGKANGLANIAIHGFAGLEEAGYDPRLASSNPHFIVQVELLKAFIKRIVFVRVPIIAVSGAFRLFRDVPRRTHAGLRWYLATVSVVSVVWDTVVMNVSQSYDDPAPWATLAWAAGLLGTINFLYGPSKRAGMVVTVTTANSLSVALRAVLTCMALQCIASLLVLTVIVSVHVVELISLWLIISLLFVWTPAILDSCSTDYVALLSGAFAWLARSMGYLTRRGSVRFGLLVALWWLAACMIYNSTTNLSRNRHGGIAAVVAFFLWVTSPNRGETSAIAEGVRRAATATIHTLEETAVAMHEEGSPTSSAAGAPPRRNRDNRDVSPQVPEVTNFLADRLRRLCDVADYDAGHRAQTADWKGGPFSSVRHQMSFPSSPADTEDAERVLAGRDLFSHSVHIAILLSAAALLVNYIYSRRVGSDTALRMRRNNVVLVTPTVLCWKAIRTLVLVFCVLSFLASTLVFRAYFLPYITGFLPDFVSHGISVSIGCVVLGALMDTKESLYNGVARVLGLLDPPVMTEDGLPVQRSAHAEDMLDPWEDWVEDPDLSES